ncbi:HmuY family protein [Olivibacter sp. CPCC 100613]|uniref:HmuY family protein n=1 Tax=Olivibacter sp. CPCC 100613 TaxID=3079931 RepID=UPI002FF4CDFE
MKTRRSRCCWLRYLNWLFDADRRLFLGLAVSTLLVIGCSKKESEITPGYEDGKSIVIQDLAGDTDASMSDGVDGKEKRPFYIFLYRFSDKRQIWIRNAADSAKYLRTTEWDLAFTGPYNSEIYVNNGHDELNPGFGSPATQTAVVKYDRPYTSLNEAPSDDVFSQSEVSKIGWASGENSNGWFHYSLNTHLVIPIKNRVYAIRLADGKYAKLELINVYKGNPPTVTDLNWPAPYFTFRYFVQQDGSRNLNTQ